MNGRISRNKLGYFKKHGPSDEMGLKYIELSNMINIVSRRSDFEGIELVTMLENQMPFNVFEENALEKAYFHEENSTYEMRPYTSGLFFQLFTILERKLNFTGRLLKRKDGKWGSKDPTKPNGWNGMIENILDQSADLISASLTMSQVRYEVVDYLTPIGMETYSIFIKSVNSEAISWQTYGMPLTQNVWITLICIAFTITTLIYFSNNVMEKKKKSPLLFGEFGTVFRLLWTTFTANFSGKPAVPPGKNNWPSRILVFFCLLAGSLIWIHYRASFTSELAVRKDSMPFDSLEGLLTSDYSLIVKKGGNSESAFTSANPDNIFGKLNSQKVSDFLPTAEAVVKLNGSDNPLAFYYAIETILNFKEFKCHLIPAWITRYPGVLSFALPKNSPYKVFLDIAVIKLRETGPWHLLRARFEEEVPTCKSPPKGTPLGVEKIFTLFLVFFSGAAGGIVLLILENICRPQSAKKPKNSNSLGNHPLLLTTAIDSVQNLSKILFGLPNIESDDEGVLKKLQELQQALDQAKLKAKILD